MSMSACLWACWSLTSPLIPLKHNKSYLKPRWTCRGSHSQENHLQLNLCSTSFLPPSPRGPPLAELHLGGWWCWEWWSAPIARTDRCSRPEPSTEPPELSLSAYTLALITVIHMVPLKNLGTLLGQIKFTRHSRVAPCLWGDEVTVLQACEGCGAKGGKQQTWGDLHCSCVLILGIFPLLWSYTPAGR